MGDKWIPVDRIMPDIIEYCYVTSGYQSKIVEIITLDGCIYKASLQLYGSSHGGWKSEWWEYGMLGGEHFESDIVCGWRDIGEDLVEDELFAMSFDKCVEVYQYYTKFRKERKMKIESKKKR